jgi:hypothetical protein
LRGGFAAPAPLLQRLRVNFVFYTAACGGSAFNPLPMSTHRFKEMQVLPFVTLFDVGHLLVEIKV